ncbi:TIGR02301 family protein [Parvularcula marina]|uniref:TIGR02301 family protein n=1 Tax=Parvularcula marina TaxID=2292771 RepID=UPI0035163BEF
MRLLSALIFMLSSLAGLAHAAPPGTVEAQESFESRQRDLVALAGHLGMLHRLHQLCGDGYREGLYRVRMQQIVELEVPMGSTRLDMVAAFNSAYRDASRDYLACGVDAQTLYESEAKQALLVVERLYAPFR